MDSTFCNNEYWIRLISEEMSKQQREDKKNSTVIKDINNNKKLEFLIKFLASML